LNQADDQLVRLGEIGPGDIVLDATLGLAADALVCARAVGASGRVIGVEASLPLFLLVKEGLARMRPFPKSCAVEPRLGRAEALLAELPDGSVDCELFDPMFDRPRRASQAFDVLRRFALHEPLTEETLLEARRVARRWVVVKVGRYAEPSGSSGLPQTRRPARVARVAPRLRNVGGAERGQSSPQPSRPNGRSRSVGMTAGQRKSAPARSRSSGREVYRRRALGLLAEPEFSSLP
jgi:hypothetical protein